MSLDEDLKQLAIQEERLQFDSFNSGTAFDIQLAGHPRGLYVHAIKFP